ncbi:MAG: hypothetical protein WC621_02185 [Patescibacteria group bacterium]
MKLAVLFWFYQKSDICKNRLELIKRYNPRLPIYGLYGGTKKEVSKYRKLLVPLLNDFYVSSKHAKSTAWKWIHGDLMILDWYKKQGRRLKWDSIVVIQWDALVLGSIKKQFPGLKNDQLFISGTRILDKNIEVRWNWTKPQSKRRNDYVAFKKYLEQKYGYKGRLLCSLFILQILPRSFFRKWQEIPNKERGMLEYKIPTYAKIFGTPIYKRNLGVWWFDSRGKRGETPLNARGVEIKKSLILSELKRKNGFRIFHPYNRIWP